MNGYFRAPANQGSFASVFLGVNVPDPLTEVCASDPSADHLRFAVTDGTNYLYSDQLDLQPGPKVSGVSLSGQSLPEVNQILLECYDAYGSYLSNTNLEYTGLPLFTTLNQPFNAASANSQISSAIKDYSLSALVIISAVLLVGIAYLVFRMGWRAIKNVVSGSYGEAFNLHGESRFQNETDDEFSWSEPGSWTGKPTRGVDFIREEARETYDGDFEFSRPKSKYD